VIEASSESTPNNAYGLLHELADRFQSASNSLERSYKDLQETVRTLSLQLQKERDERIRLERLAAMGELAMELAHEIRNPLGSIELYASMAEGEYAEQIVRSVRLLNHTVSNILQFGTAIHPVLKEVRFSQLLNGVRDLLQPLAAKKKSGHSRVLRLGLHWCRRLRIAAPDAFEPGSQRAASNSCGGKNLFVSRGGRGRYTHYHQGHRPRNSIRHTAPNI
jgi:signal transduction histidine kinase